MSDALSSIGGFFGGDTGKGLLDIFKLGAAGSGLIGNIMNERARSQELSRINAAEKTLADPVALSKQVAAATLPLNEGLVQSVGNTVDASLAERGLAQAPGIARAELSQALAPFEQANQNAALQLVLTRLGLPLEYARTFLAGLPPNVNLAPLLALLGQGGGGSGSFGPDMASFLRLLNGPQDTSMISADTSGFMNLFPEDTTMIPASTDLIPPDVFYGG